MNPLVSVVIDTFNQERFIEEAIVSVLDQGFARSEMEILVVDDGSSDRTPEIVRKFEPEVRLLSKPNGGQASAVNFGVAHAKGDLVTFLDGDDVWLANKLSHVAEEFAKAPRTVMAYHKFVFWDSEDNSVWEPDYFAEVSGDVLADRRKLLTYIAAPTSSLTFRRDALQRLLPTPEKCSFSHDAYLTTTAIFLGPVACIPEILTKNRVHGNNLWFAGRGDPNPEALRRRIETREAAIESIRNWTCVNAPESSLPQSRVFLRRWRMIQTKDQFHLKPPGRFRLFMFQVKHNVTFHPIMSRSLFLYNWGAAFAMLTFGREGSRHLESTRTRIKQFRRFIARRFRPARQASD